MVNRLLDRGFKKPVDIFTQYLCFFKKLNTAFFTSVFVPTAGRGIYNSKL